MTCLCVSNAFAQSANFEGFAASFGVNLNSSKSVQKSGYPSDNGNGDSGIAGTLDFSYAQAVDNNFLIVVGASYDLGDKKTGYQYWLNDEWYKYDSKLKNSYAIYIKPQYALNNSTALYAKLSYNIATAHIVDNGEIVDAGTYSNRVRGLGYGVGTQVFLTKNVFTALEINRINYQATNGILYEGAAAPYKPQTTSGVVSLGYKF